MIQPRIAARTELKVNEDIFHKINVQALLNSIQKVHVKTVVYPLLQIVSH